MWFTDIIFLSPQYLYLVPLVLWIIFFFLRRKNKRAIIQTRIVHDAKNIWKSLLSLFYVKSLLVSLIILLFSVLLANPNTTNTKETIKKNGIDIVLALDVSKSMEAVDLQPSRIESAKSVIQKFVSKLETDRLWLVVFAGKPYTSVPMTFDYKIVKETLDTITTDSLNQSVYGLDGTAIGDALLMAQNLIEQWNKDHIWNKEDEDKNREKVIILLTDWDANRWADPILVARSLKRIKIYTIGIGSEKGWQIPYNFWWFIRYQNIPPLNEITLRKIANISSWMFFRATDTQTFENIFDELSHLEKHDIEVNTKKKYQSHYAPFILILIVLLLTYSTIQIFTFKD